MQSGNQPLISKLKGSSCPNIRSKSSYKLPNCSGISKLKLSNCPNATSKSSNCVIVLRNCPNVTSKSSNCVIVIRKSIVCFTAEVSAWQSTSGTSLN